jgi:PAS domain S-box-containing protein
MSRFPFASLRARSLLLVLLAVVPFLGLTIYTNIDLRRLAAADAKAEALRLARLAASDQQDTIKDTRQLLFALAQLPDVMGDDQSACSAFLAGLLNQYPQYTLVGVISPDGALSCSALPAQGPVNLADRDFFQRAFETGDFVIGSYQEDPISGKAALDSGLPILDESGQVRAVVFVSLDLAWLNQLAAEARLPEGSTFTVIDRHGTILVRYPDPGMWVGQSLPEAPIVETILEQQGEGTAEADGVDGIPRLFAFTPLVSLPGGGGEVYVSVGIPAAVAFSDANRVLIRNLIGLGLVSVLALAAAWFGGNLFILRRVNALLSATKRLSAGDLSVRTGLPYGYGELSQLARVFDEMADSLERRIAERDQAAQALQESKRALSTLMSNLPGMAYRSLNDRDRTLEFVSEGCLDLTGYVPLDLINGRTSYAHLIHAEDREPIWNEIQIALGKGVPFQLTYRIRTALGEVKWVWEQGRGVVRSSGDPVALEGFITDITERILAHQTLEQRVIDRTRELSALYDVTAVASASLELETVLDRSLDRVLAVMGSELGAIHLLDEIGETLHLASGRGIPADQVDRISSVPVGSGLVGLVIEQGDPLVLADIGTGPRPLLALPASDFQGYVGVPIRARGHILGVISVVLERGRSFTPEEVALLDSIADRIGVAVENARLYDAEQKQRRQADTLLEVVSAVGSTLELDQVLSHILDQLQRVVGYDSASVQLLQEGSLQVVAGRGFPDEEQVLGITFALYEESPNRKVIEEGRPLNLADAPTLYPAFHEPPHAHIQSWLGVPLRVQERVIGIITLDRAKPGGYRAEEVRLATAFADQVALALENARLYQEAEQLAVMKERSRLARDLHDSVTQALYSMTLLAEAAQRLAGAGNLEQVRSYLTRLGEAALQSLKEMRLLVYELRPPILEKVGLVGALQQRLDAVEGRSGVETRLRVEGTLELPAPVEEGLYRIAQEALNNALKHAAASLMTVWLRADGEQVELEVVDNGIGFDPETGSDRGGVGMLSMQERAERLGGSLSILSAPGSGTRVIVRVDTGGDAPTSSQSVVSALDFPEVSP